MVYTVTFNPALDYVLNVESLSSDDVNRAVSDELYYGGKGINVSAVLSQLGIPTAALALSAALPAKSSAECLKQTELKAIL